MIWMELRCDAVSANPECYSRQSKAPMRLMSNSVADVQYFRRVLLEDARRDGWFVSRTHGVVCPSCRDFRGETEQ